MFMLSRLQHKRLFRGGSAELSEGKIWEQNQVLLLLESCLNPRGSHVSSRFMSWLKIPPTPPPQCVGWGSNMVPFAPQHSLLSQYRAQTTASLSSQLLNWKVSQPWPHHGSGHTLCTWQLFLQPQNYPSIKYRYIHHTIQTKNISWHLIVEGCSSLGLASDKREDISASFIVPAHHVYSCLLVYRLIYMRFFTWTTHNLNPEWKCPE